MLKFRLWDTEHKKMVRAKNSEKPYKALQVRTNEDGSKLYVYDHSQRIELQNPQSADVKTYWPVWKSLTDEEVGYYLTNEPTDLYSWDSWDEASYRFMNWTTVLQSWKVDEGETPEYTGDTPTKAADAQYTYTFSGWKPTVWPIYKKTDFKAQFSSTVNEYTVSISSNNIDYWTVDESSVSDIPYWTKLSTENNVLTIWEGRSAVEVTATAEDGYVFSSWWEVPVTVTGNTSIQANFAFGPLQNYVLPVDGNALTIFGDAEAENYVQVSVETDPEAWDNGVSVDVWWLFDDDFFVGTYGEENQNWWEYIFYDLFDSEYVEYLITEWEDATAWEWKSGVWSALQTYYATPTKTNADAVITAMEATIDDVTWKYEPITWTIPEPEPDDRGKKII